MVACFALEPACISNIVNFAAVLGSSLDLILLVKVTVGCVSVKRQVVRLVGIVFLELTLFSRFSLKLGFVGSGSIEPGRIGSKLSWARSGFSYLYFVLHVAFIVLGLIIKLGRIGLIGVSRLVLGRFVPFLFVVCSVGWVEEGGVIVNFIERIAAFLDPFDLNVMGVVEFLIGCATTEGHMPGRTMVLSCIIAFVLQVHISHTHLASDAIIFSGRFSWGWGATVAIEE